MQRKMGTLTKRMQMTRCFGCAFGVESEFKDGAGQPRNID